jgi:predicted protein tyrosine phosphatase
MHPIIRVAPEAEFLAENLNPYRYAISILETARSTAVLRPEYRGTRLNLYFDDAIEGPNIARPEDIERLYEFSRRWLSVARRNLLSARLIVHCMAGISRSAAVAMMPLTLYYGDFREAARQLFLSRQYLRPNTHILHLIEEQLYPGQKSNIFEAVSEFQT